MSALFEDGLTLQRHSAGRRISRLANRLARRLVQPWPVALGWCAAVALTAGTLIVVYMLLQFFMMAVGLGLGSAA